MLTEFLIMRSSVCVTADRTRPIIRNYSRSRRLALVFFSCCSRPTAVICSPDRCVSCRRRRLMSRSWPVYYFFSPILLPPGVGSCRLLCLRRSILSVVSLFLFFFFLRHVTRAASAYRSRRQRCDGCHALARRKWPGVAVNRSQSL